MLEQWALIEADFQREYAMDLSVHLDRTSWRRFSSLLSGLSPQSAFVNYMASKQSPQKPRAILLSDPRAIAASVRGKSRR